MDEIRDWDLEYDGAAPPLPDEFRRNWKANADGINYAKLAEKLLPEGAYLLRFAPKIVAMREFTAPRVFLGVLRIHHRIERDKKSKKKTKICTSGSGDLYVLPMEESGEIEEKLSKLKGNEIPEHFQAMLPPDGCRYYLRLESLWITASKQVVLGFETLRFEDLDKGWERRQSLTLRLDGPVPSIHDRDLHPMNRTVLNSRETEIGEMRVLRLTYPSKSGKKELPAPLRGAVVKIHPQQDVDYAPLMKLLEKGVGFLRRAGWSIRFEVEKEIPPHRRGHWTRTRLRNYHREYISDDGAAWIYHLLIVNEIQLGDGKPRGLMYDLGDGRDGDAPRQGAALAADQMSSWDHAGPSPPIEEIWLRTALHELGHMQGLFHNPSSPGLMQPLEYLADAWNLERESSHADKDALRLRHLPDLWVRQGGVPFAYRYRASGVDVLDLVPAGEGPSADLHLTVEPVRTRSIEAPVEVVVKLRNGGSVDVLCPLPRYAEPRHARLGLSMVTPSGDRRELLTIAFPRRLRGTEATSVLKDEEITYRIAWDDAWNARAAGVYLLSVHLLWIVKQDLPKPRHDLYHVSGIGRLLVV